MIVNVFRMGQNLRQPPISKVAKIDISHKDHHRIIRLKVYVFPQPCLVDMDGFVSSLLLVFYENNMVSVCRPCVCLEC